MSIRLTDTGGLFALGVLFGATAKPTSFTVQLFTDINPAADSDTNTTHTVAAGGGYADKTIVNDAAAEIDNGVPMVSWTALVWTFTGPLTGNPTIHGYQVLTGSTLIFEEVLDNPFTPTLSGDQLTIPLRFRLGNGTPA